MKTNNSCASVLAAGIIANTAPASESVRVYFGTQAKDGQRGIYMARLDTQTGTLGDAIRVSDSVRPGFIAIHPDGKHLYATEATGTAPASSDGAVSAYRIEADGSLTDLNTRPSGGTGPCHISLSPDSKKLLVANYRAGTCAVLPILPDGTLGEPAAIRRHSGSGPHPKRQETAHTHSFNCTPDGKFALAADLGIDQILIYRLGADGSLLSNNPAFTSTAPGAGPRHLSFSPDGQFVYACMELNATVSAFNYTAGQLDEIQTISTLPDDFNGENTTSEVRITPDGRFLYIGNRGHESLAIFSIDRETGLLTAIGHEPTRGKHPRHFNIDPGGNFLIVANAHTDNIVVFRINKENGQLAFTGSEITVPTATCVQFFKIPD